MNLTLFFSGNSFLDFTVYFFTLTLITAKVPQGWVQKQSS